MLAQEADFVFRIPYSVLRDDWMDYAVRNTHHGRLAQPGLCEPSAISDYAISRTGDSHELV